jgi:hypothetical protein
MLAAGQARTCRTHTRSRSGQQHAAKALRPPIRQPFTSPLGAATVDSASTVPKVICVGEALFGASFDAQTTPRTSIHMKHKLILFTSMNVAHGSGAATGSHDQKCPAMQISLLMTAAFLVRKLNHGRHTLAVHL